MWTFPLLCGCRVFSASRRVKHNPVLCLNKTHTTQAKSGAHNHNPPLHTSKRNKERTKGNKQQRKCLCLGPSNNVSGPGHSRHSRATLCGVHGCWQACFPFWEGKLVGNEGKSMGIFTSFSAWNPHPPVVVLLLRVPCGFLSLLYRACCFAFLFVVLLGKQHNAPRLGSFSFSSNSCELLLWNMTKTVVGNMGWLFCFAVLLCVVLSSHTCMVALATECGIGELSKSTQEA